MRQWLRDVRDPAIWSTPALLAQWQALQWRGHAKGVLTALLVLLLCSSFVTFDAGMLVASLGLDTVFTLLEIQLMVAVALLVVDPLKGLLARLHPHTRRRWRARFDGWRWMVSRDARRP